MDVLLFSLRGWEWGGPVRVLREVEIKRGREVHGKARRFVSSDDRSMHDRRKGGNVKRVRRTLREGRSRVPGWRVCLGTDGGGRPCPVVGENLEDVLRQRISESGKLGPTVGELYRCTQTRVLWKVHRRGMSGRALRGSNTNRTTGHKNILHTGISDPPKYLLKLLVTPDEESSGALPRPSSVLFLKTCNRPITLLPVSLFGVLTVLSSETFLSPPFCRYGWTHPVGRVLGSL